MRYHTTADLTGLANGLVSLAEIGLDVGEDVQFVMTGNRIDIRRISVANRKGTTGNQVKFNRSAPELSSAQKRPEFFMFPEVQHFGDDDDQRRRQPLAEVALALAMAFFGLMILMLLAMVNAPGRCHRRRPRHRGMAAES